MDCGRTGRNSRRRVREFAARSGGRPKILGDRNHMLADQAIVRVGPLFRQASGGSRLDKSIAILATVIMKSPQAGQRAQAILVIIKALRNLENRCPGSADLGNGAAGKHQRAGKRGMELHLARAGRRSLRSG